MKKCSDHMTVLVIDSESEKSYVRRGMPIVPVLADPQNMALRPRRLRLAQGHSGYGFLLRQEKITAGRPVHMLREVDAGSPAEAAGIKDGELLLEVNGESTDSLGHEDVVSKIRQSGKHVTLTTMTVHGQDLYTQVGEVDALIRDSESEFRIRYKSYSTVKP
ncbi:hypothetical protein P4O66_016299, partial [Electrophorus voltai]